MRLNIKLYLILFIGIISYTSCKKFIELSPSKTEVTVSAVFTNEATATAALIGIYQRMSMVSSIYASLVDDISTFAALSSDEFKDYSLSDRAEFEQNILQPKNINVGKFWSEPYKYIFSVNQILEELPKSEAINIAVKNQIIGEAKFLRAFNYFYLTNFFGDVPLPLSTNYEVNGQLKRTDKDTVIEQVIQDLKDAVELLPLDYSASKNEKVRANKLTAYALLARTYLYKNDWTNAAAIAGLLIEENNLVKMNTDPNEVFKANSDEAIWQLIPQTGHVANAQKYLLTGKPEFVALTTHLTGAFEANDQRKVKWTDAITVDGITYNFPTKYKNASIPDYSEYLMIFRLSEQYLIRAEAYAQLDMFDESKNDLDIIRTRAGLPDISADTKDALLSVILHERQVELFTEFGHRWFDLKRTGMATTVLSAIKPNWSSNAIYYPIPLSEIGNNSNLTQNTGY